MSLKGLKTLLNSGVDHSGVPENMSPCWVAVENAFCICNASVT